MNIVLPARCNIINVLADVHLAPYVDAFKQYLTDCGYAANTTHRYVEADLTMKEKALAWLKAARRQDAPFPGSGLAHAVPADAINYAQIAPAFNTQHHRGRRSRSQPTCA